MSLQIYYWSKAFDKYSMEKSHGDWTIGSYILNIICITYLLHSTDLIRFFSSFLTTRLSLETFLLDYHSSQAEHTLNPGSIKKDILFT